MDKPQILIVEDDLDLAEMLNSYFRVQNYEVLTAAWGEEALQISRDNDLNLIVLDIRLPDIDGYEVCRQLRSQRRTQDTPIIFLTEKRDRVDKLQGLELGVVDYITKPFDIQELRLRVRNAINRANRQSLVNPVTDLPEGRMVDERLEALLQATTPWAVLRINIDSISRFREMYGFVAADDVLRAVTLMVRNAVREHGTPDDYVGHIEAEDFVIITHPDSVARIRERIESRVAQSREYFYPLKDREKARAAMEESQLKVLSGVVEHASGPFEDLDDLKTALDNAMPDSVQKQPLPETSEPESEASAEPAAVPNEEQPKTENKPEETKPVEPKSEETKTEEAKPENEKPLAVKSEDQKSDESKPAEKASQPDQTQQPSGSAKDP